MATNKSEQSNLLSSSWCQHRWQIMATVAAITVIAVLSACTTPKDTPSAEPVSGQPPSTPEPTPVQPVVTLEVTPTAEATSVPDDQVREEDESGTIEATPEPEVEEEVDPPEEVETEPEPEVEEEVDPPKEVETEPEPEVEEHPCSDLIGESEFIYVAVPTVDKILNVDTLQFCCPNNALQMDRSGRCFGDKGYEPDTIGYFGGCSGGWVLDVGLRCPGEESYGVTKCIGGAIELIYNICPNDYGYGYYGYGEDLVGHRLADIIGDTGVPWLKCLGGVIMDAYGRCPGDEFYYGEQQCPDGGSVIDYYGRCPSDNDYGMGWKE